MKVLHLMLSCFYVDNFNYQENVLPRQNKKDGHQVKIIASTETYIDGKIDYLEPSSYKNEDDIDVVRLPYKKFLPHFVMRKLRIYENLYKSIEEFSPDIILCHGLPFLDINEVVRYKISNNNVKLYLDSHEDQVNSGLNFISKHILHNFLYRQSLISAYNHVEKIYYLSPETKQFITKSYKVPEHLLEYWPLGGEIIEKRIRDEYRKEIRDSLGFSEEEIIFVHSGKMDKLKRTEELLQAFISGKNSRFRLLIIGVFTGEVEANAISLINCDERIQYLGWKNSQELQKYLCAADMYIQPGSQSVTLQNAMCCGAGVIMYPSPIYMNLVKENGLYVKSFQDIVNTLERLSRNPQEILDFKVKAISLAEKELDYAKIAKRYI